MSKTCDIIRDVEDTEQYTVMIGGTKRGRLERAKAGPGFFMYIDGVTFQNAPGARYAQERDFKAPATYCKTVSKAKQTLEGLIRTGQVT